MIKHLLLHITQCKQMCQRVILYEREDPSTETFRPRTADQTGFFIAASDFDLLDHVSRMIKRQGMVGMMDTAGRMQYLVDGRKGTPLAARRIMDTTQKLVRDMMMDPDELKPLRVLAVDEVMRRWQLMPRLKGYRYLRYMLVVAAGNDACSVR
jgi:hypothetical protein